MFAKRFQTKKDLLYNLNNFLALPKVLIDDSLSMLYNNLFTQYSSIGTYKFLYSFLSTVEKSILKSEKKNLRKMCGGLKIVAHFF